MQTKRRGVSSSHPRAIGRGDVVIVPFPFRERNATKRRPALALSSAEFVERTGTVVLAMITTKGHQPWPHDVALSDLRAAGLKTDCVIRWKLATRDVRMILARAGKLGAADRKAARAALTRAIAV